VRDGPLVPIVWALLLAPFAVMLWVWSPSALQDALLGGAAVAAALVGVALALRARSAAGDDRPRPVPDLSPSAALIAIALATMLVGASAGPWLIWIGAGLLASALFLLARELRTSRRQP
jgi:peptidoglycan/LPS O-acetylase OafA/YrhL